MCTGCVYLPFNIICLHYTAAAGWPVYYNLIICLLTEWWVTWRRGRSLCHSAACIQSALTARRANHLIIISSLTVKRYSLIRSSVRKASSTCLISQNTETDGLNAMWYVTIFLAQDLSYSIHMLSEVMKHHNLMITPFHTGVKPWVCSLPVCHSCAQLAHWHW